MKILLVQNFGNAAPSDIVLRRIDSLAARHPSFLLRYDRLDDACAMLATLAGSDSAEAWATLPKATPQATLLERRADQARAISIDGLVVRADDIVLRQTETGAFLADRTGGGIFALDALGAAIWEALAEPVAIADLVEELVELYPQVERCRIEGDLTDLISRLMEKGLARAL